MLDFFCENVFTFRVKLLHLGCINYTDSSKVVRRGVALTAPLRQSFFSQ